MSSLASVEFAALDPLDAARRDADENIQFPLTLVDLAAVAELSAYNFVRQFSARFGISPMAYVRERRLALAAAQLRQGAPPPLITLAFDCGFDSQEGFTRAFKRAYGVTPGRYRRQGPRLVSQESLTMTTAAPTHLRLSQSPAPIRKGALRIAGLTQTFDDQTKAGIPDLWQRLVPLLPLPGQASRETFGVCAAAGSPGAMRYTAGVPLASGAPAPAGIDVIELAPQSYLVFRQVLDGGPLHSQMQAAASEIWGARLPASGHRLAPAPDLEFYPAGFEPDQPDAAVEWWIPVET